VEKLYLSEVQTSKLITSFAFLAVFISCLGLLGLSTLITQQRIKEIGIRRVNGAEIRGIVHLLNRAFLKWVLLSCILAMPLAWLGMHRWLQAFTYKIGLSWWIFVSAGLIALLLSGITVSIQSWKAARRNPLESLRYE